MARNFTLEPRNVAFKFSLYDHILLLYVRCTKISSEDNSGIIFCF